MEVKKTIAKDLPTGWIGEIRETKTANRIRRDSVIYHLFLFVVSFGIWIYYLTMHSVSFIYLVP